MYSFSYLEPVCSMSASNCCFLTFIQISQEAGQMVWYSHLLKNFPQFVAVSNYMALIISIFLFHNVSIIYNVMLSYIVYYQYYMGFLGGSDSKESACNVGDLGLIPGLGRSPGRRHATCSSILAWRIPMDRGAWRATVHGVTKSQTRLSY